MNCRQCQQQIVESLAAGQQLLSAEAADHLHFCARCAEYFQSQRELFRSIDAGLHSFVNQPIPPSFLPGVRMRLEERPSLAPNARLPWQLAAVSAVALLAVCVGYVSRAPVLRVRSFPNAVMSERAISDSPSLPIKPASPSPVLLHTKGTKHSHSSVPTSTAPEVLVSAEERQAFARFVADDPESAEMAVLLASPGGEVARDSAEIALLQIKSLVVKPLDDSASE
jgi:hypothetical protein